MRGSAAFRAAVAPGGVLAGPWVKNELWRRARAVPSLDLRFADNKSLVDATTGQNLVTFTRASSGTYVDSQGVIRSAVTNTQTRSEEFNNASWTLVGATVDANSAIAPNGSATADKLVEASTLSQNYAVNPSTAMTSGVTYVQSIYAKAAGRNFLQLTFQGATHGPNFWANFDLSTGVVAQANGLGINAQIQNVGNGWYRCSISAAATTTASSGVVPTLATSGTDTRLPAYTGNGTSGIYIWGAQLEQSSTVGEYVPTTSTVNSAPRFDHDPTTGESLGLLVEESRTNLLLQSQDFSTTWTPSNTTVSTNQAVAPDGNTTAGKILEAATTSEHNIRQDTASQAAGTYTLSIFAKAAERTNLQFVSTGVLGGFRANFDLTNGVLGSVDAQLTASIQPYQNGWYRCIVTATSTSTGALRAQWNIITSPAAARVESYAGDITKGLYLWGAQIEAGSFPTSYVNTTTATVTRSADVASISGSNFSGWYRQGEGTVFADAINPAISTTIYTVSDGTTSNRIYVDTSATSRVARVITGSVTQANNGIPYIYGRQQKFALSYLLNAINFANAGTLGAEDTAATIPTVDQLRVGANPIGNNILSSTIARLTYWPQRLPNNVLQEITR